MSDVLHGSHMLLQCCALVQEAAIDDDRRDDDHNTATTCTDHKHTFRRMPPLSLILVYWEKRRCRSEMDSNDALMRIAYLERDTSQYMCVDAYTIL